MSALAAGKPAPDFSLPATTGERFSLTSALKSGPALVVFFKVSCPVCQYSFPFVERIFQAYPKSAFTVVGVSQNDLGASKQFMRAYGGSFPVLLDDPAGYAVSNAYGLTNVPTFFLISPDGKIAFSCVAWVRAEIEQINALVAEFLGRPPATIFQPGEQVADWKPG